MYGSQTGNAQSIAEGVHQGCKERGLTSTLLACDGWKKVRAKKRLWRCKGGGREGGKGKGIVGVVGGVAMGGGVGGGIGGDGGGGGWCWCWSWCW